LSAPGFLPTPARAFWVVAPGQGEIRLEPLPEPGPNQVLVKTLFSAVSRGTESLVFRGQVPPSEYERMRCPHQQGEFPGPVKYGYSNVGRILLGPAELEGRLVFCLYPHQTSYVVEREEVALVPDDVPAERAVLAANLETAVNAVWDARPSLGDRVSVVGAGVIGCLLARLIGRMPGTEVELVDVRPEREAVATALGVDFRVPDASSLERDLVFHASASAAGLRTALELAGTGAKIVELSWFGDREISLPLGAAFHARRLSLVSSQVGTVSPNARPRFDYAQRMAFALSLLNDPAFDLLFSDEAAFDSLPETMNALADPGTDVLCQRVRYG
jgi:threonine dehydrogenase-like Zn-dependent dehydrogenase